MKNNDTKSKSKKILNSMIILLLFTGILTSCGNTDESDEKKISDSSIISEADEEISTTDETTESQITTTKKSKNKKEATTTETKKSSVTTKSKEQNKSKEQKSSTSKETKSKTKKETKKETKNEKSNTAPPVQTPAENTPHVDEPVEQKPVVTSPPATKPVPTTIPYSERTYTKYDITSDDPEIAINALEQLACDMDLFNGYVHQNQYGGTLGGRTIYGIIIALNYDQNINPEALNYYFEYESEEEFKQYCDNIDLAYYQSLYGSNIDFRKYIIDENLANFINNVSKQYKDARNGNRTALDNTINSYFAANSESIDDYVKYYFMTCTKDEYNDYNSDEMNYARELYFENIVKPIYHSFK